MNSSAGTILADRASGRTRSECDGHSRRRGVAESLLFAAAIRALRRAAARRAHHVARTTDASRYRAWRAEELERQVRDHFEPRGIEGKDVLDFGCGTGELSRRLASWGAARVVGVDLSAEAIGKAKADHDSSRATFLHADRPDRIPCVDAAFDLICCFDVLEHVQDVPLVVHEWRRVLRPGGRVWIWWSPWRGPYGHHLDSLIPLPWVHLLFSERTLFRVCADVYDHPSFIPRRWDIDPSTGEKKPNKWRRTATFHPFLNKLTRGRFESSLAPAGLHIARCRTNGFSGSRAGRSTRVLLPIPFLGECFVSSYVYELIRV
ncbi:MAG: class I SAM-dependent methyltransferase [Phycisphaerae bacterium]|nr:class I SAM-dependent methyltransferase [Phycisphaerae bacterium]